MSSGKAASEYNFQTRFHKKQMISIQVYNRFIFRNLRVHKNLAMPCFRIKIAEKSYAFTGVIFHERTQTAETLYCGRHIFCSDCRNTFAFSVRMDEPQLHHGPFYACQRIRMGTHEAAVFSYAAVFAFYGRQTQKSISLHNFCTLFWNSGWNDMYSYSFLCLYICCRKKHFYPGSRHFSFQYNNCFFSGISTDAVLQDAGIYCRFMHPCVHPVCLLYRIYLPSSLFWYVFGRQHMKCRKKSLETIPLIQRAKKNCQ